MFQVLGRRAHLLRFERYTNFLDTTGIGLDVGKSSHWACGAKRGGEALASKPVATGVGRYSPYIQNRCTRSA